MYLRSLVSTVPPSSAKATTAASTAEPRPAWARRVPARRASRSGRSSMMIQVLRNRSTIVSVFGRPDSDSTSTIEGTTGGQIPSRLSKETAEVAFWLERERRLTPPESRTSSVIRQPASSSALAAPSPRIRLTSASACAHASAEGSPTSWIISAMYRSVSSSTACRCLSARTASCSNLETGNCRSFTTWYRSSGRCTCNPGISSRYTITGSLSTPHPGGLRAWRPADGWRSGRSAARW